jgi:hypothetical protein
MPLAPSFLPRPLQRPVRPHCSPVTLDAAPHLATRALQLPLSLLLLRLQLLLLLPLSPQQLLLCLLLQL